MTCIATSNAAEENKCSGIAPPEPMETYRHFDQPGDGELLFD